MSSDAQRKAVAKYDAANTRKITVKLNLKTDADIIEWLDAQPDGMQPAIKKAIRATIRATQPDNPTIV